MFTSEPLAIAHKCVALEEKSEELPIIQWITKQ